MATKKTAKKATKSVAAKKATKAVKKVVAKKAVKAAAPKKPRAPRKPKAPVEPVVAQEVVVEDTGFTADELANAVEPTPIAVFPDGTVAYDNGVYGQADQTVAQQGFWARVKQWLTS